MNDVLSALPFSVLLIFATGPLFFLILETSISKGIKSAFLIDLGAVFADIVFVTIAFLGTKSLLTDIKDNPNLFILGGVLLLVYAIISAIISPKIPVLVKLPQPIIITPIKAKKIVTHVNRLGFSFNKKIEKIAAKIGEAAINTNVLATEVCCIE